MKNKQHIQNLVLASMFLALAFVLPFLTGQMPTLGNALCPMHIPVLLCGFICGPVWGLTIGAVSPIVRSLIFSMPPLFPIAVSMAFELAVYGFVAGILYKSLPKKIPTVYLSLLVAMISGRLVWGGVRFIFAGLGKSDFGLSAFFAGAIVNSVPGIIIQILLIPAIVIVYEKMKRKRNN